MTRPTRKTSITLPNAVLDSMFNHPAAALNFHSFSLASLDSFIAAGTKPLSNKKLSIALGCVVAKEQPLTFAPPKSLGKTLTHYKAIAARHGVSLSALVASAIASALGIFPTSES